MATLQKFKLLATQCGVAQSPTKSPATSPLVHLRRRKSSLKMLLSRSSSRRWPSRRESPTQQQRLLTDLTAKNKSSKDVVGRTLKDLFVSSPPFEEEPEEMVDRNGKGKSGVIIPKLNGGGASMDVVLGGGLRDETGSPRPGWIGFRHRLLRRAWRPMLVTIPE